MENPLVSVIIPAYNAQKYIAAAITSVFEQGYGALETIVIDDGSTDGTLEALKKFGSAIRIISQENKGQAAARNVGIRCAKGFIIGLLDADDRWPRDHISLMLPYLEEKSEYDVVRGLTRYVKTTGSGFEEMSEAVLMETLVGACLYKKSAFDIVGLFDETMRQGEDFDWNIRLAESRCKEKRIDSTALFYCRHDQNVTNEKEHMKQGQLHAFRNKVARMKLKNGQPS